MSGDVQPRKRKDKKKKKDELPTPEELRGTVAAFGEGDVLIHSQQEHGTGGHWCAKIIFFSLLAVLVALVGLIILENRGLSELEANSVETRYTGVLDGWTEEVADDHHDEHTLELNHPNEEEHDESEAEDGDSAEDVLLEDIEREVDDIIPEPYGQPDDKEDGPEQDDEEQSEEEGDEDNQSEGDDDDDGDDEYLEQDDDDDDDQGQDSEQEEDVDSAGNDERPYEELEESSEQLPTDSLLEEEEYEREQEQQRRLEEEEGHVWLKGAVGVALLVATHAVVRRARAALENEEGETIEDSAMASAPVTIDRRMTIVLDEPPVTAVTSEPLKAKRVIREPTPPEEPEEEPDEAPALEQDDEDEVDEEIVVPISSSKSQTIKKILYEEEETEPIPDQTEPEAEDSEVADDVEIIEDDEQGENEMEDDGDEEVEEEEISDVDDVELLTRLEAKYGKLPEPERYGYKKDGANMIPEEEWGEEPDEERWRRELDLAQEEMNRGLLD